jgi:hypothetical protein
MAHPAYERAREHGLTPASVQILICVSYWFNGYSFEIHNGKRNIGSDHEPTIRQLCSARNWWSEAHESEFKRLRANGFFKTPGEDENAVYIAARRCKWLPTEKCFRFIREILYDVEEMYPFWVLDEHTGPPTFRDGPEHMTHRKGVLASYWGFKQLNHVSSGDLYPRYDSRQVLPDLVLSSHGSRLARVEVLSDHNNRDSWISKWDAWRSRQDDPTVWVFERREEAARFFNHLINQGKIELDRGRFRGDLSNWSTDRINRRLQRSRKGSPAYASHDVVVTIPQLIGMSKFAAFELFDDFDII